MTLTRFRRSAVSRSFVVALVMVTSALLVLGPAFADLQRIVRSKPQLHIARASHTSTQLADGDILVIGGERDGQTVADAEIINSDSLSVRLGARLAFARAEHSASLLADGRVLVAGGRDSAGALDSIEMYDPQSGLFSFAGRMSVPRVGHTATQLLDGDVLIAGGDGRGTAEIFRAATSTFSLVAAPMSSQRQNHSSITLKDGRVLIVGGSDGQGRALQTAEIFNPQTGEFITIGEMRSPRLAPTLRLLPDGKVQVIAGQGLVTMEMFNPRGYFTAQVRLPNSLLRKSAGSGFNAGVSSVGSSRDAAPARVAKFDGATETSLPNGRTLRVGGNDAKGRALNTVEVLSDSVEAWVTTDKTDYPPGEVVTITGGGFLAGETINLVITRSPQTAEERQMTFTSVADASGNFVNTDFVTLEEDFGASFLLTATGATSGRQAFTSFTDAHSLSSVSPATGSTSGGTAVTISGSGFLPATQASYVVKFDGLNATGVTRTNSNTLTATTPAHALGFVNVAVTMTTSSASETVTLTNGFQYVAACTAVSVATDPTPQSVTYGDNGTFTASATGNPAPTVQWQVSTGGPFTDVPGAISTTLVVTAPTVAQSGSQYRAVFTNTCGGTQTATTNAATLTVTPATVTVTPDSGQSKVYGTTDPVLSYALTQSVTVSGALNRVAGEPVGAYAIGLGSLASTSNNYTLVLSSTPVTFAITPASLTITADSSSKTYGQTVTFAGTEFTTSTLFNGDTVTSVSLTSAGAAATATVSGYPIVPSGASGTGLGNYTISYVDGTLTVDPASLTITADSSSKTYGQTVTFAGTEFTTSTLFNGDTVTSVSLTSAGAAATATVSGYPIVPSGASGTGLGNYTISYVDGTLTVDPASLTITADSSSKTYGQTVTFAGTEFTTSTLFNGDTVTSVSLTSAGAAATATVGGYPIVPSGASGTGLGNYTISYVDGTLTVDPASLTITADSSSKTYGQTVNFAGTEFTTAGLINGNTVASVTLASAGAPASATVDTYPIVPSDASGTGLGNYTISYVNGTLTVDPASLTITANSSSKTYGQSVIFAGNEFTTAGLINGNTVTSVTLASAGAPASATVNTYPIVPSNASGTGLGNYTISYVNGTLTVDLASLTITANSSSKTYGQAVTFAGTEFTTSTLFNSDTVNSVTLTSTGAGAFAPAGSYTIVPSAASGSGLTNYTINYVNGTLTVLQAAATVTYTGPEFITATAKKNGGFTATITSSATVQVPVGTIPSGMTIVFTADNGGTGCTAPVGSIGGTNTTGTATCTWEVTSNNLPGATYTVTATLASQNYSGSDVGSVNVAAPGTNFITGGGHVILGSTSAGLYPGSAGTKTNFGFNVKYNRSGTNLQGNLNVILRQVVGATTRVYQVKGNVLSQLSVSGNKATFNGKANMTDITNPLNPVSLGGNLVLQLDMSDNGEPGSGDTIGLTVYNGDGGLMFSNSWSGTKSLEQTLNGGNLSVK
jgi:hypothetical protein